MLRIIIGLILVLFEFNLGAENNVLGLLPDFVGYLFLFFGMKAEQEKCISYKKDKMYMLPFCVFSYGIYLGNLYGLIESTKIPVIDVEASIVASIVSMCICIYSTYVIYKGLKMVEERFSVVLKTKRVMYIWRIRVLCSFLENFAKIALLFEMWLVMSIANIVAGVVVVVYVTQVAIIYSELKRNNRLKSKGER